MGHLAPGSFSDSRSSGLLGLFVFNILLGLRVILMVARMRIINVDLSTVVVGKLLYSRNGPVMTLVGLVFLDTMPRLA